MKSKGRGFTIEWRDTERWCVGGVMENLAFGDRVFAPALGRSFFEIDEAPVAVRTHGEGFQLRAEGLRLRAEASSAAPREGAQLPSGTMRIEPGDEIGLEFAAEASPAEQLGLSLGLPEDAEVHLAEYYNVGRRLDGGMPVGESYEGKLAYGFLVVRVAGMWIRFRVDRPSMNRARVLVVRLPSMLALTIRWLVEDPLRITAFRTLEESTADFASRLEAGLGIRKLRSDATRPDWVGGTRLIFTVDMMRSSGEIAHDFADVETLCGELHRVGCPENTLLYLPGWQGPYDAVHPTYRPAEKLGGGEDFRRMIEAAHSGGYRVMIHTTGWGIDPYHPDIDRLIELARKDENGDFEGWQLGYTNRPPRRDLGFITDRIAVFLPESPAEKGTPGAPFSPHPAEAGSVVEVTTPAVPCSCEALLSVGGLEGYPGRVRIGCGARSVVTPPGWFADHGDYGFPFPLLLGPGENRLSVSFAGAPAPRSEPWYRIRYSFIPESPYSPWTWPILRADTSHPDYVRIFVENVSGVVKEFGVDAVHVDATTLGWPPGVRTLFTALRDALPGIPINTELYTEFEGLGYWSFSQNAAQSLVAGRAGPEEQQSLPVKCGLPELFAWLDRPSPVCDFARDYIRTYPHLCAVNAFVPVGKVCNTFPPRLMPMRIEEQWRVLRDAKRLGYIPTMRVNFREYGLDGETVKAIEELTGQG